MNIQGATNCWGLDPRLWLWWIVLILDIIACVNFMFTAPDSSTILLSAIVGISLRHIHSILRCLLVFLIRKLFLVVVIVIPDGCVDICRRVFVIFDDWWWVQSLWADVISRVVNVTQNCIRRWTAVMLIDLRWRLCFCEHKIECWFTLTSSHVWNLHRKRI